MFSKPPLKTEVMLRHSSGQWDVGRGGCESSVFWLSGPTTRKEMPLSFGYSMFGKGKLSGYSWSSNTAPAATIEEVTPHGVRR